MKLKNEDIAFWIVLVFMFFLIFAVIRMFFGMGEIVELLRKINGKF